jgi:hypothetical protein
VRDGIFWGKFVAVERTIAVSWGQHKRSSCRSRESSRKARNLLFGALGDVSCDGKSGARHGEEEGF